MSQHSLQKKCYTIHGMHCASCEVLIERKWKKIPGVEKVNVNHATGRAEIVYNQEPDLGRLQHEITKHGYTVSHEKSTPQAPLQSTKKEYIETGAVFFIVVVIYLLLKRFDILPDLGISENMSYGFVFVIGLVAAMSTCIAVTGGLLLAVAGKYNERYPNLTGAQKFKPHIYFNIGRVISYTVFGGIVGGLGSMLTLSTKTTGFITIIASVVMILLGFQLLKIFPGLRRFQPKMPKFIAHKVHDLSSSESKAGPFVLGGATFFLPCGFTQALQLYVLSSGDITTGALTMFFFSLGTLPALLSLSAISSFARGSFQRYFMKAAGVVVILLGFFNINNGLALTGNSLNFGGDEEVTGKSAGALDPNVTLVNGVQVVEMTLNGLTYTPSRFTVQQGVPVEWRVDGTRAQGCAQVLTMPKLGITKYLSADNVTVITFTPQNTGTLEFSCPMGMTTRGAGFTVVSNSGSAPQAPNNNAAPAQIKPGCDPSVQQCLPAQKISMEISREKGFYPNTFTVKKGVPVELTIDAKIKLGGCMGTMVIPDYNIAHALSLGKTTLTFTPTEAGVVPFTCSMGNRLGEFIVTI